MTNPNDIDWGKLGLTSVTVRPAVAGSQLDTLVGEHEQAYDKDETPELQPESDATGENTNDVDWGKFVSTSPATKQPSIPMMGLEATGELGKRTLGVGVGVLNAPYAFLWGMMSADLTDPKEYNKLPGWQQLAVSLGGGFVSALESIAKPGSWGTRYGDYYKGTTGKTIQQDFSALLKNTGVKGYDVWAKRLSPSLELIADVLTDPLTALVPAAQLAKLRAPKGFVGEIPLHVMDQIEYLNHLEDIDMREAAKEVLKRAYDAKLWGIQEGGSWQGVRPSPIVHDVSRGGIIEGETIGPTLGRDLKVGQVQEEHFGRTHDVVSGGDVAPKATMGVEVPKEPSTVPEAARRIMDVARIRRDRYIAEGNLAKSSGIGALGFINKVRKRLGLPSYEDAKVAAQQRDELFGTFVSLQKGAFARGVTKDKAVEQFDLGTLVQAANKVFGPDETLRALRIIEKEDSEVGRTLKAALPDLEKTLGSGQFTESLEGTSKSGLSMRFDASEAETEAGRARRVKKLEEAESEEIRTKQKAKTKFMEDMLKRGQGAPVGHTKEPSPPTKPGVQTMKPKGQVDELDQGMRAADEGDIFDTLNDVDVDVPRPTPAEIAQTIVPGKTLKHVPIKAGNKVPGIGDILGTTETKDNTWWVRYIDENTGKLRVRPLDEVMKRAQATEPQVTLDMLGFQKMFDELAGNIRKMRIQHQMKTPFQMQIPADKLMTPDWDKIVKRRKTIKYKGKQIFAPEIRGLEKNITQNLNELPEGAFRELFENPIRNFEHAGPEAVELFYRPVKEAEHAIAMERRVLDKWIRDLRSRIPFESRKRIGTYAIAQQKSTILDPVAKKYVPYNDGLERLKAMGVTDIPVLNEQEIQVYNIMRQKLDEFYVRLNAARVASGHAPFPKVQNYFTFMHDFNVLEARGINPMTQGLDTIERFLHPTATPFKYAKPRGKTLLPLELDAFTIMDRYLPQAIKHIHMSPRIAKIREMTGIFEDTVTKDKWQLSQTHPNFYKFVNDWLTYQAGIQQGTVLFHGKIASAITALNRNLTFALLSYNLRTMGIQASALRNTIPEIGVKYAFQGVRDLFEATVNKQLWREPFARSNVLLGRAYDVSLQQALDAIKAGRVGQVKQIIGKTGMKPIQWLDIATAWATWRGAYRKGLADGLSKPKAANYADDVVVKTQASGAPSDISKIQRSGEGRMLTLLQTFTINDFNFFVRDVLGMGNPRLGTSEKVSKLGKYLVATTLINMIYEDVMGMRSPFPTPLRAAGEALDAGESLPSASWQMMKELLENVPIIGGGIRYGQTPFGPMAQFGEDVMQQAYKGDIFTPKSLELLAKGAGVPGTGQVSKAGREYARGEPPWTWLAGKRTINEKTAKEGHM